MTDRLSHEDILARLREIARQRDAKDKLPFETVQLLKDNCPLYDWVGIYTVVSADELTLGPFLGRPSPHTRIKIGSGICGAAVQQQDTIIVDDVTGDPRYLACSLETKSEIVAPIFKGDKVVGEIDVDSDTRAAFTEEDKRFLQRVCEILATAY
jgi:GAF domain-containing protein